VNQTIESSLLRFAVLGALVVVLGLAACGRKAGLDPPPAAAVSAEGTATPVSVQPGTGPDGQPIAPATGLKRRIFLDWLLD
jgi:predicted small lipoprotein YifL